MRCVLHGEVGDEADATLKYDRKMGWVHQADGGWHTIQGTHVVPEGNGFFEAPPPSHGKCSGHPPLPTRRPPPEDV